MNLPTHMSGLISKHADANHFLSIFFNIWINQISFFEYLKFWNCFQLNSISLYFVTFFFVYWYRCFFESSVSHICLEILHSCWQLRVDHNGFEYWGTSCPWSFRWHSEKCRWLLLIAIILLCALWQSAILSPVCSTGSF